MRTLFPKTLGTSLAAGLVLSLSAMGARAQEPKPLGPEVVSILGQPEAAGAALDADVIAVLGQPEGGAPVESALKGRSAEIASKLRCPVCQGVSISDSPSGMATNMRAQVRELVAKGYSEEQIMKYFERSYGEFVRLEPPMRGLNVMLWIMPAVVLFAGGAFVVWKARQPVVAVAAGETANGGGSGPTPEVDPALAKYLERIRRDSGTSS